MTGDASSPVRRVGILGDIHAEDVLLAVALEFLRETPGLDALWFVGDVVTGLGDAGRCVDLLEAAEAVGVRGNHERWLLDNPTAYRQTLDRATPEEELSLEHRAFLAALATTREFDTPLGRLLLCHGIGTDDMAALYPDDEGFALMTNHRLNRLVSEGIYRFVVNGHKHRRMVRPIEGLTIISAGTLRRDQEPGFLIADFAEGWVQSHRLDPATSAVSEGKRVPQ